MRTDSTIQRDVLAELEWEPSVTHEHIGVAVTNGIVTLSGLVPNYVEKLAAEEAVRRVAGVRAVAEDIKVRWPGDPKTSDTEIAERICRMFSWDAVIPEKKIKVRVEGSRVTLTGEVDHRFQADAARKAAGRINGVISVANLLTVTEVPAVDDVKDRIEQAFKRNAILDAATISVIADGGTITLGGRVHAWREREMAERAAWAAPGVTAVRDQIIIA
ncbi:BON domain-containing protein [Sphingomonas aerophila]|uniref:Osmotically-inducible protein OsmY n=1 Tax=Sphingomonas aerophila TaxID=1344948 RepID=A0A7W9BCJ6_9SPHN|nr:BON domain-containing protein [Sphingomonas aerophila]MBB5714494.1 osmotically-inducible protein OsmY [Sphingomonas aerophila]